MLCVGCVVVVVVDDDVVAVSTVCSGIVLCVGVFVCKSDALMILSRHSSVWRKLYLEFTSIESTKWRNELFSLFTMVTSERHSLSVWLSI